jgi:hypothetical protein
MAKANPSPPAIMLDEGTRTMISHRHGSWRLGRTGPATSISSSAMRISLTLPGVSLMIAGRPRWLPDLLPFRNLSGQFRLLSATVL